MSKICEYQKCAIVPTESTAKTFLSISSKRTSKDSMVIILFTFMCCKFRVIKYVNLTQQSLFFSTQHEHERHITILIEFERVFKAINVAFLFV